MVAPRLGCQRPRDVSESKFDGVFSGRENVCLNFKRSRPRPLECERRRLFPREKKQRHKWIPSSRCSPEGTGPQ